MMAIWNEEMHEAWNMKTSLELQGKAAEERLRKSGMKEDVIREVVRLRATRESSLARVYSGRANISHRTARNALHIYLELTHTKISAQP